MYDALKMRYRYRTYDKTSQNMIHDLVKISRLAVRHPAWEKLFACYQSPGDISNRNLLSFTNNRFISPLVSFILYCFRRCDWAGDDAFTGADIFRSAPMCYGRFHILSTATRLIYPADRRHFVNETSFS